MKTNVLTILKFSRAAEIFNAEGDNKQTKLGYAIKRVASQLEKIQTDYRQAREDISIDNAAVDEKGILLTEPDGKFRYTPEKLKARNRQWQDLDEDNRFEIEPYFATDIPSDLSDDLREAFSGFVIRPEESKLEAVA